MPAKQGAPAIDPPPGREAILRALGVAATVAAVTLGVVLSVRKISSYDTGYHLAYGEHFLATGRIVQTNRFIYTRLDKAILADPENLGPGCRYNPETDTYYFVNANWLSQVVMAAVYRTGGFDALWVLQSALVAAIFALAIVTMRRGQVPWHWVAPAVLLVAMTAYERFSLRPEMFGYLMLLGQWLLLSGPGFGRRGAAGVIALQILAVNLHSYFLLGIALTGAMFADAFLRWIWARAVTRGQAGALDPRMKWLGIATAGVVLASLCNPWFVHGASMPIQTLLFMRKHELAGGTVAGSAHPWATLAESSSPFAKAYRGTRNTNAYVVLLAVTGVAGMIALLRRRWGWLFALAGMAVVSLSMRRNMAPAAMILAPLSMIAFTDGWRRLRKRPSRMRRASPAKSRRELWQLLRRLSGPAVAAATIALSAWWTVAVVTQRFYLTEHRNWRLGRGLSRISLPLAAARWINANPPKGRIFCDYDVSSNLMFFTRPRRRMPVLTNTWAIPPYVLEWVLHCTAARRSFDPVVEEYDIGAVVLRSAAGTKPLMYRLSRHPRWAVVSIDVKQVIFVRKDGPDSELAAEHEITRQSFDVEKFAERVSTADPVSAHALDSAARVLFQLGWGDHAIAVWRRAVRTPPEYFEALRDLGACLSIRGDSRLRLMKDHAGDHPARAERYRAEAWNDFTEAEKRFRRALKIKPRDAGLRKNLAAVQSRLRVLRPDRVAPPPGS